MSGWKECRLGDVATVHGGKRLPKGKMLTALPTNHPYIRITDFSGHKILLDGIQYVDDEIQKSIERFTVDAGDLVISIVGTLGLCAIIPKELDKANLTENCAKIHIKEDNVEKLFLYYHLISTETQDTIVGFDVGSTQPKLPLYNVQNINLLLPSLPEQRAIAGVLSSLDDKIDLLHRQNKTLEGMAEALWRKMFVEEADPGWQKVKVSDIIEVRDGTHESPKQTEYGYHLITSRHLKKEGIDYSNAYKISEEDYRQINKRSKVDKHDLLFSMIGTLGLIHYVDEEPNFAIKNIGLFKSSQKPEFAKFLYLLLKSPFGDDFIFENADGSTQEYISLGNLRGFTFQYPGDKAINHFGKFILPYFEKIFSNNIQIRTLSKLRDTLLPRLMNGEVRVELEELKT